VFVWHYLDDSGDELGRSGSFPDREAAEAWIGECWADLLESGIDEVALIDEERSERVYRMGLSTD
jgi:hypothetical protein